MDYEKLIHDDLVAYAETTRSSITSVDAGSLSVIETFLDALEDAQPYVQAQLVLAGYSLCGGEDQTVAMTAARALQMVHTFTEFTKQGNVLAGLQGMHAAQIMLANMAVDAPLKLKAVGITNRALLLYANATTSKDTAATNVLDSYVTEAFLNPLHVGMVLAGADCDATDAITPFVTNAGRAQLAEDPKKAKAYREAALKHWPEVQAFWPDTDLDQLSELLVPAL